jgi:hypothetical protein
MDLFWHECDFTGLNALGAMHMQLSISMSSLNTEPGFFNLDDFTATSPVSQVRFSFFNYYSGLGVTSDLLIPELNYQGTWYRVWNNEIDVAQGEIVGWQVTDYFGQTVAMSNAITLTNDTVYIDVPVKLVTVHISRPQWWTSDLPPEWFLTYLPSGKELTTTGWDLEIIAGWYSFGWPEQQVNPPVGNGTEGAATAVRYVVQNGTMQEQIDGNMSSASSFSMQNFFLSMKPTLSQGYAYTNSTMLPENTWSFAGIYNWIVDVYTVVNGSTEYKVMFWIICLAGAAITIEGIILRAKKGPKIYDQGAKK